MAIVREFSRELAVMPVSIPFDTQINPEPRTEQSRNPVDA
jgi:hypothetical protein